MTAPSSRPLTSLQFQRRSWIALASAMLASLMLLAVPAGAQIKVPDNARTTFEGSFEQGGLIVGQTEPGATVRLRYKEIRVSPDGEFLVGFSRDEEERVDLNIVYSDGRIENFDLIVAKREYDIQRINNLPRKMVSPGAREMERIKNDVVRVGKARSQDRPEPNFREGFIWPVEGIVSGVFGSQRILNGKPRRPHFGIDIAAPKGREVVAAMSGIVTMAHDLYFTGSTIIIDHGYGLSTTYSHLASMTVREGDRVEQGDLIGTVGSTGRSTGPHLDWRMNLFRVRLDPAMTVGPMPPQ